MEKLSFLIAFGLLGIFFIGISIYLLATGYNPDVFLLTLIFAGFVFATLTVIAFILFLSSLRNNSQLKAKFLDKEEKFIFFLALGIIAIICLVTAVVLFTIGYPPDLLLLVLVLAGFAFTALAIAALFLYLAAIQTLQTENRELLVFGVAIAALVITGVLRLMDKITQEMWLNITLLIITNLITGKVVYEYVRRQAG